ncbi:MAG: type II toxin-antitoxin system VapB family antitoxin [Chloroflexi bacterium]|nr:type II toxin-antitoxin system VapB family antitoxin [Chloroflexota bacterium]
MGLSIKNEVTYRLVKDLAETTGESLTEAVTEAVRERLKRVRGTTQQPLHNRLVAIGRACAPRLKEPFRSMEHGDLLYGDDGLPS